MSMCVKVDSTLHCSQQSWLTITWQCAHHIKLLWLHFFFLLTTCHCYFATDAGKAAISKQVINHKCPKSRNMPAAMLASRVCLIWKFCWPWVRNFVIIKNKCGTFIDATGKSCHVHKFNRKFFRGSFSQRSKHMWHPCWWLLNGRVSGDRKTNEQTDGQHHGDVNPHLVTLWQELNNKINSLTVIKNI